MKRNNLLVDLDNHLHIDHQLLHTSMQNSGCGGSDHPEYLVNKENVHFQQETVINNPASAIEIPVSVEEKSKPQSKPRCYYIMLLQLYLQIILLTNQ